MPWCEPCAKYWTPNAMNNDGTCPRCGEQVLEPHNHVDGAGAADGSGREAVAEDKAPWHFKLMVVALIVYLSWRVVAIFV